MKIAIDIREIKENNITGIARILRSFLDNLDLEKRAQLVLFADGQTDIDAYSKDYRIVKLASPFTLWFDQVSIVKALKSEKVDLFWSPYYKVPFFAPCKVMVTICDLHFMSKLLRNSLKERFKPYMIYLKQATKKAHKIMTISEFSKREICEKLDCRPSKIDVVYLGIDEKFNCDRTVLKEETVLYCGNYFPHKNLKTVIRSFAKLKQDIKNKFKLEIVAKQSEYFNEIKGMIADLNIEDRVEFYDHLSDSKLVEKMQKARVLMFPSFYEGFGFPPLEAMACGTAVISSNATSLSEVLGNSAILHDPDDLNSFANSLETLLYDEKLQQEFIDKGLERVKHFTVEKFVDSLWKVIVS